MRRFWRGTAIFLLGGVLGTAFGIALGFFFFPYVFPPHEPLIHDPAHFHGCLQQKLTMTR